MVPILLQAFAHGTLALLFSVGAVDMATEIVGAAEQVAALQADLTTTFPFRLASRGSNGPKKALVHIRQEQLQLRPLERPLQSCSREHSPQKVRDGKGMGMDDDGGEAPVAVDLELGHCWSLESDLCS